MWFALLTCCLAPFTAAQRRDPLNDKEIDEMRESADYPDKRLELMVGFARARMASIAAASASTPRAPRIVPLQIHDLLAGLHLPAG